MKPLKIGITFVNDSRDETAWGVNGHAQNVKFLHDLMLELGHETWFITPDDEVTERVIQGRHYQQINVQNSLDQKMPFDLMFEAGVTLGEEARQLYRDKSGAKIISLRYGNSYFLDVEGLFTKKDLNPGLHFTNSDEVWISPHFVKTQSYFETLYNAPSRIAPFIWEPHFCPGPFNLSNYPEVMDVFVMEPNMSVLKNALIPMMIIERLYQESPDSFGRATVCNSRHFQSEQRFLDNFVKNLPSQIDHNEKVYFADRGRIGEVFKRPGVLLGHQHENSLNYLYLEALFMGLPLVHNSPAMKEVGYFYEEMDVYGGVKAMQRALSSFDFHEAMKAGKAYLAQYSIHNPEVQKQYQALLAAAVNAG